MPIQAEAMGRRFTFPDGTPPAEIELAIDQYFSQQNGISPVIEQLAMQDRDARDQQVMAQQQEQARTASHPISGSRVKPIGGRCSCGWLVHSLILFAVCSK